MPRMTVPRIVVHVPHSSTLVPEDLRASLLLRDGDLARELLAMTDHYTNELFSLPRADTATIVFPVSRLVVDPERFADDAHEPMAQKGMGAIYTTTSDGHPLRPPPSAEERARLLARFYEPHHAALEAAVTDALAAHGTCLAVDAHSFPSRALPYENDQREDRPEICIGTDPSHTPAALRDAARAAFEREGFIVDIDRPFSGALVPMAFFKRDARVRALMIEVNRRLYMDEATGARLSAFSAVRAHVLAALQAVLDS